MMIFTETEKQTLSALLMCNGWLNAAEWDLDIKVLRKLCRIEWKVNRGRVANIWSRGEGHQEEFRIDREFGYDLCRKCFNPFDKRELHIDQCTDCSGHIPSIIAKEIIEKYKRYDFTKDRDYNKVYLGLSYHYNGSTLLDNVIVSVASALGGAYYSIGNMSFTNETIVVSVYSMLGYMRNDFKNKVASHFFYSDPNCFEQFHEYLQKTAVAYRELERRKNQRLWKGLR